MDKFRKWKSLYSATANSFGTGEGVTITPSSVVGLPTDTDITLTFDRQVEGKLERITGRVTGGNFVVSTGGRGADNTTEQAHTSPTIEHVPTGTDINDMVDGILEEHGQDGTHDATKIVKMTGNQTIAGVKTFSSSPVVPAPTTDLQAATKKYVDDNAGAGGKYVFIIPGTAATGTDVAGTWFTPGAGTIDSVDLFADTAGATNATTIDLNIDGTTAFTTQGNRPSLSDTATTDIGNVPDVTAFTASQKVTIDIDAVTTQAPIDLYVVIKYSE